MNRGPIAPRDMEPGGVIASRGGGISYIKARKETDDGWWLVGGTGYGDVVISGGNHWYIGGTDAAKGLAALIQAFGSPVVPNDSVVES